MSERRFRTGIGIFTSAMRWSAEPLAELQDLVGTIERAGFDFVAFPQHLSIPAELAAELGRNWRDPLVLSAVTIASSSRLAVVTTIVIAPLYGESLLRQAATTLTWLGPGRFELGLGAGYLRADFADDAQFAARFRLLRATAISLHEQVPALPLRIGGGTGQAAALARRLGATWAPTAGAGMTIQEAVAAGGAVIPTTDWLEVERVAEEIGRWRSVGATGLVVRLKARTPAALAQSIVALGLELLGSLGPPNSL